MDLLVLVNMTLEMEVVPQDFWDRRTLAYAAARRGKVGGYQESNLFEYSEASLAKVEGF